MITSKEKFSVGQRVRMTQEALDAGLDGAIVKRSTGIVKDIPERSNIGEPLALVRVLRDGEKVARTYHMDFWEPEN